MLSGRQSVHAHAETLRHDSIPILVITGEVDQETVDVMFVELDECLLTRPKAMVLDLSGVTFLGSAGLRLLLHAQLDMEERHAQLAVVAEHNAVLKPLRITDMDQLLAMYPSRVDALVAIGSGSTGRR